jgi:putative peptidoglycan binding protein
LASAYSFSILVHTNQIQTDEAAQSQRFAADGAFVSGFQNSPAVVNWPSALTKLNAAKWLISEDWAGDGTGATRVSTAAGKRVDAAMVYQEQAGLSTTITDQQIADWATHVMPIGGVLGPSIVVLTRSYAQSDPSFSNIDHAIDNPNVSGAMMEFNNDYKPDDLGMKEFVRRILGVHKKAYLLLVADAKKADYLGQIQADVAYLAQNGLLDDPNLFIVLAIYGRPSVFHFLNSSPSDHNSVETVLKWLHDFRNAPTMGCIDLVDVSGVAHGWALDPDDPSTNISVDFYTNDAGGQPTVGVAGGIIANGSRPDVNSVTGYSGDHGFSYQVPDQYRDGTHSLYPYGISTKTNGPNALLCGAPQAIPAKPAAPSCTPDGTSPQTQTLACPAGQSGSITQTRTSSCPGPTWSSWTTISSSCTPTPVAPPVQPVPPAITSPSPPVSVPVSTKQLCVYITKNLAFGSRGSDVLSLQTIFISTGLLTADSATGYFGKLTQAAVQSWQRSHNIVPAGTPSTTGYGVVGPRTRASLARCN